MRKEVAASVVEPTHSKLAMDIKMRIGFAFMVETEW